MKTLLTIQNHIISRIDYSAYEIELANNQLLIPTADLPADFSTETYTIIDGQLVPASAEVISERTTLRLAAERESIRIAREQSYNSEEISSLYWNWVESGNEVDKAKWVAAKDAVREELPYPGGDVAEGGEE